MAKIRRVIRKTRPTGQSVFDEQFWPVILAMFVLGGFLLGIVSAYLESNDARFYANAWTWTIAIPIIICLALWGLRYVDSHSLRRGVQFSAVLCVILHLFLFVAALETDIFGQFWEELASAARVPQQREPVIEPVYEPIQLEPQHPSQQVYLRPTATEMPDPAKAELSPEKQPQVQPQTAADRIPVPATEPQPAVSLSQRQSPATTVPRYSEQLGKLSRQQADVRPQMESPTPPVESLAEQPPTPLQAPRQTVEPRSTPIQAERRESAVESETEPGERTARLDRRREQQDPQTDRIETRPMPRTLADNLNRAVSAVDVPQSESRTSEQLQAQASTTRRRPSVAPAEETPRDTPRETRATVDTSHERVRRAEQPVPAAAPAPRSARRLSAPQIASAAQIEAMGTVATRSPNIRPQMTSVQRAADAASAAADATSSLNQVPTRPSASAIRATSRRATSIAAKPTTDSTSTLASEVARTSRRGSIQTTRQVQAPQSVAQSQTGEDNEAEPARTALTRSLAGSAGVGQSPNFDRAFPAAESPAMIASGSARRTNSTQQMPEGPALAPTAPAVVRHSVADSQRPGATLRATTPNNAPKRGAAQPTELNATASAGIRRAASDADPSTVTASAGVIDVDMGPTRVVDGSGSSRAAGGGQPELQLEKTVRDLARRRRSSPPAGAIRSVDQPDVATVQDEAAENRNTGGLAPAATDVQQAAANPVAPQSPATGTAAPPNAIAVTAPLSMARSNGSAGAGDQANEQGSLHRTRRSPEIRGPQLAADGPVVALSAAGPAAEGNVDGAEPSTLTARSAPAPALASRRNTEVRQSLAKDNSAKGVSTSLS